MNIHFIAIGGAVMHNLAIALHKKSYTITGSDDEIFEPSRSRLEKYNLLPKQYGWNTDLIHTSLDAVILGMHARKDNPELIKAKELGIKIYSFPEYLYEQTKEKLRIVIGGSHGKTTTTSMLMHILKNLNKNFDYMVGASINGFDTMVNLENNTEIAVLEGDEYLSSPIDMRPKFHLYKPHIAVLTGIAWDHINVFPSFENYKKQFEDFINCIEPNGTLIYFQEDNILNKLIANGRKDINYIPYTQIKNRLIDSVTYITDSKETNYKTNIFGEHNMQNLEAVKNICSLLKISEKSFYKLISSFEGSSKRMENIYKDNDKIVFKDFAHSPSKLKATVDAVKNQYPTKTIIACMELHTFSSLNAEFLPQYAKTMSNADIAIVYFDKHSLKHKKLPDLNTEFVKECFKKENINVFNKKEELINFMKELNYKNSCSIFMSSGNFSGINLIDLVNTKNKTNTEA